MTCPSCGVPTPEEARFCPACGASLQPVGDERRIVTVLFADIVGFTSYSEARDPEHVKNLVDRCFERLVADITSYGGRVDKIVGDAIVALFGAPVAHEDDAERAVRAALQMQRTLRGIAADLGAPVQMRVGVNTGEVLVGALRVGGDYTAMGDVVNTASRLQGLAEPGSVLVGAETYAATRDVIRYEPLGPVQARGREEPVEAWRAVEAVVRPGRRPRRSRAPLVGRDRERALLGLAVSAAVANQRPGLALVVGEAGMGKSRLVEEVALAAAREHGAVTLEGRAIPYGEVNVWWPVAEAVRQAAGIEPDDDAESSRTKCRIAVSDALGRGVADPEVERVTEALLYLMGYATALSDVDHTRARSELARAVRVFLSGLARRRPVVLLLSDLHWADEAVLDLVDRLAQADRIPLVILATARPELAGRWNPSPGRQNLVVLHLDPLDAHASTRLLATLLGHEPSAELRDALLERSGGNPFFLEELAALLTEAELPVESTGRLDTLPATLRGLVAARLDALPAAERDLLEDAAVLGRRGPVAALYALAAERGDAEPARALRGLVNKDLLVVDGPLCWFKSDVVREVAYGTLTKADRARAHALLARWLAGQASRVDREDEQLEELARHYAAAAELVRELGAVPGIGLDLVSEALDAIERAADRADERESHRLAHTLYDQALRLAPEEDGPRRRHFLIGRARAAMALGRSAEARADLDQVLESAEAAGDTVALARALTVLGEAQRHEGSYRSSIETLDRAIELWRQAGDRRGEAAALRRQGMTYMFAGDLDSAEKAVVEALQAFLEIGARRGEAWALQNLAWIAFIRGDTELADDRLAAASEVFTAIGDWGGLGWTMGLLAWVRFHQGRVAEAERLALQIYEEAGERGDTWGQSMLGVLLAHIRLFQGRTGEAIERARAALETFEETGNGYGAGLAIGPLVRGLLAAGRPGEARALLDEAVERARRGEGGQFVGIVGILPVIAAVQAGEPEPALASFAAREGKIPGGRGIGAPEWLTCHALALLQSGDAEAACEAFEEVRAVWGEQPNAFISATAALVRAAAGHRAEAEEAMRSLDEAPGTTYLDRVTALLAAGCAAAADGEESVARTRLDEALAIADGTEDRLTQAVARLARARALEALGTTDAADALGDARARLASIGLPATGWDTAYALAAGVTPRVERA